MEKICGIYLLSWGNTEDKLIYVGKSVDVYIRLKSHLNHLTKGTHSNYLVQKVFNTFNIPPKCTILEQCLPEELNEKEIYWHNELNSVSEGLNIAIPGQGGFGTEHNTSKYSKIAIIKAFILLCKIPQLPYTYISKRTGVSTGVLSLIRSGNTHVWLKYAYPDRYNILSNRETIKALPGTFNSNSKYSRKTILKCLSLLAKKPNMTQQNIADRVGVPRHVITSIRAGSHKWLQTEYPKEYSLMLSRVPTAKKISGTNNPNSKYSRKTILKCMCLLVRNKTNRQIADRLNMDIAAVNKVRRKIQHKWIGIEFPEMYSKF